MIEPTPLSPHAQAKRQHILEVATHLFGQHGFEETSMKQLAAEAQVSTSAIYTFFGDREDLLLEVVSARIAQIVQSAAVLGRTGQDPVDTLAETLRYVNRDFSSDPLLSRLLILQDHVMGPRWREHMGRLLQVLDAIAASLLRQATCDDQLWCSDPEGLVAVMRFSMQGWLLNTLRGADTVPEARMTEALIEMLYRAAGREPPGPPEAQGAS